MTLQSLKTILNTLVQIFPDPAARGQVSGTNEPGGQGQPVERAVRDSEPVSIFIFKTFSDPFSGRISYFKVMSGVLKNDATLVNYARGSSERLQHVQVMQGKTGAEAELRMKAEHTATAAIPTSSRFW